MTDSIKLQRTPRGAWPGQDEMDLLRHYCRQDFWSFFLYAFGAGINPLGRRWIQNDTHEPLARWFQQHVDEWFAARQHGAGEKKNLAVLVHRRVGKTTMITRAGQLWLHLRDPEIATYTGAENGALSAKMLAAIKAVMDGSDPHALFTQLYGNWATSARSWTGKEIVHAARRNTSRQDPSLGTFAVETSITGGHPDAVFYDDPISYERLETDTNWLETVNSQVTSLFPALESDALVVWVGTRYDDGDHFGTAFRDEGVASVSGMETDGLKPEPGGKWHVYFMAGRERPNEEHPEGKPSTPKVWPESELRRYQKKSPLRYASQVMNDPEMAEHTPLTRAQIAQCVVEKEAVPWNSLRYAICCDTAFWDGSSVIGKDETVMVVHGYPRNGSGDVYVIEAYGSPSWRAEDFGKRLIVLVQNYRRLGRRIFRITDEVTMAGKKGAWADSLKNMFNSYNEPMPGGTLLEFTRNSEKKESRLVTAASFWVDGHVRVVKDAPGVDRVMDQMARIGAYMLNKKTKIDWADAHSDAFQEELYQGMRREQPRPRVLPGATVMSQYEGFDEDETRAWEYENPRPPIRTP